MVISRESRLPLYFQIRQEIEQDMLDKKFVPGDKLPSEDELATEFKVSRMTIRRAIDQLVSQGKLRRIQGRGTFVLDQSSKPKAVGITRWSFEALDHNAEVKRTVLKVEEASPSLRVANALHTMPGEPIIQITWLLLLKDEPLGYRVDQIPKLIIPAIDLGELADETLTHFLAKRCGLEFGKVVERVRAIPAGEDAVKLLGVEPGSPLLHMDSLLFLTSGIPVILSDTAYRGDRYVYQGILHPLMENQEK